MYRKFILLLALVFLCSCQRPLAVTHWDAKSRAMVKKSIASKRKGGFGYPRHNNLSFLICFNESCLNRAESERYRKRYRFKGYKHKEPIPPKPSAPGQDKQQVIVQNTTQQQGAADLEVNKTYRLKHVLFWTGKAELSIEAEKELARLAEHLDNNPQLTISISGHTDNVGEEKANLALSQGRAEVVSRYLIEKGIAQRRIQAKGYGSSKPLAENDTQEGRESNRRVEFVLGLQD